MTKALHAANRAHSLCPVSSSQPIWISDTPLAETLACFAHGSRRRGSHVPGPLEARRRASKRRATYLAHANVGAPAIDPSIILGAGRQQGWWKNVASHVTEAESRSVTERQPSWFTIFPPASTSSPPPKPIRKDFEEMEGSLRWQSGLEKNVIEKYNRILSKTRNIEQLHEVFQDLGPDSVHELIYTRLAFKEMISAKWNHQEIAAFLFDPRLCPPRAPYYTDLVDELAIHTYDESSLQHIFTAICQATNLGLLSYDQIRYVLEKLHNVKTSQAGIESKLGETTAVGRYYQSMLVALHKSDVVKVEELGTDFLRDLVGRLAQEPFDGASAAVWWGLKSYTGQADAEVVADIACAWLSYLSATDQSNEITRCLKFLQKSSSRMLAQSLWITTRKLVHTKKEQTNGVPAIELWRRVLQGLDSVVTAELVAHLKNDKDDLLSRGEGLSGQQNLVIFAWMAANICYNKSEAPRLRESLSLESDFSREFVACDAQMPDAIAQIVHLFQELPLPQSQIFLLSLKDLSGGLINPITPNDALASNSKTIVDRDFHGLLDDSLYWHATHNFPDGLSVMAASVNKDISRFLELSEALIAKNKSTFRLPLRILKHNRLFKFALSQSHSQRVVLLDEWQNWHSENRRASASAAEDSKKTASLTEPEIYRQMQEDATLDSTQLEDHPLHPLDAVHFIEQLANSFAITQTASPLQAFRKVYWCYLFLHRYGAPIRSPMTRALWHAGVTRYIERGQTPGRFQWILSMVKEVEGESVAKLLLWSASFRDTRKKGMEASALPGKQRLPPRVQATAKWKLLIEKSLKSSSGQETTTLASPLTQSVAAKGMLRVATSKDTTVNLASGPEQRRS